MKRLTLKNQFSPIFIIIISGIISCIIVIISANFMFPIPGGDAEAFIPAAVSYSNGVGLKNIIYQLSYDTDILNQGRFCQYPPLFPWVVGALMLDSTTKSAFFILGLFSSISICLFTFILTFIVKSTNVSRRYDAAIIASIMIFSYTGMILPMSGRPELLASVFLLLGVIIFTCVKSLYSSVLLGVVLGLLGATHPAGATIAAVVLLLASAYTFSSPKVIQFVLTSFIIAFVTTFTIITLSPNGLTDTLAGISLHSKLQLDRTDSGLLLVLKYWILDPKGFFFGPLILFSFLIFIVKSISIYRENNTTIYYYFCSLLLVYFFYFFGFRAAPTNYNFILFQPIAYFILLYELFRKSSSNKNTLIISSSRISKNITILMLSLSLLSLFRTSFLFLDYLNSGKTYDQARHTVSSILSGNEHLFFTGSMWSLSENYEIMWSWNQEMPDRFLNTHTTENVLIQQEARRPHFIPQNGSLIKDWRYLRKPLFFGFPVGNRSQGYGFSLWNIYK